jgi:hypothetical protein
VLSVDGKELSRQKVEHTILLMALYESLDIGSDTRTPVDSSYKLPFRFTGKIDRLTYKIGPVTAGASESGGAAAAATTTVTTAVIGAGETATGIGALIIRRALRVLPKHFVMWKRAASRNRPTLPERHFGFSDFRLMM